MVRPVTSIHVFLVVPSANSRSVHRYVYQVVVPKTLAPKELVKVFEGDERIVLPPWDPMVRSEVYLLCHLPQMRMIYNLGFACLRYCLVNDKWCLSAKRVVSTVKRLFFSYELEGIFP